MAEERCRGGSQNCSSQFLEFQVPNCLYRDLALELLVAGVVAKESVEFAALSHVPIRADMDRVRSESVG